MKPDEFAFLAKFLYDRTGLALGPEKMYLVESRLGPVARARKLSGLDELVAKLRMGNDQNLVRELTDAMMTNESFFFRDTKPFDQFRQVVLPRLLQVRAERKTIRIWSAAASTGQEPYTLAMILKEEGTKLNGWKIDIVGTDLSTEALDRARNGLYTQFEVQRGLPIVMLAKYFRQVGDKWQIAPELRAMVQYRLFNLLADMAALGTFDVIFCRNVLIYFDQMTKGAVLDRMARLLASDGALYLGGAETVLGITNRFQPVAGQRGIYEVVPEGPVRLAVRA